MAAFLEVAAILPLGTLLHAKQERHRVIIHRLAAVLAPGKTQRLRDRVERVDPPGRPPSARAASRRQTGRQS